MKEKPEQFGQKQKYEIPEEIQRNELEAYDRLPDKEFWTEKNLEYWFVEDDAFGSKLWFGLSEIVGDRWPEKTSEEREEYRRFIDIMLSRSSTISEKAHAAIQAREFVLKFGISPEHLTARNIVARAYFGEAEISRDFELNSHQHPSRTILRLASYLLQSSKETHDLKDIKKVLQEEWERQQKEQKGK